MDECLLVLIVTPSIENALVDWMLAHGEIAGFTSSPVSGHGVSEYSLTTAEQVAGRQRQVMFQLHVPAGTAEQIIEGVREAFSGSGIHYWVTPLHTAGNI